MPDITMCSNGKDCQKHEECYRYMAKPDRYQSYTMYYKGDKECESYWPYGEKSEVMTNDIKEDGLDIRTQALQYISEIEKELVELKALLKAESL